MPFKNFLAIATLAIGCPAFAQFTDNFSDGDFLRTPGWSGDDARFVVTGERLRLQAPAQSGIASLATASAAVHEASWSFTVQLDFTPSSTNYAKVYLVSDQPALGGLLNGYFVRIGHTSREVSLFRQTGTSEVEIIDGLDDRVNQAVVNVAIRATRDGDGRWALFTDINRVGDFKMEGTVTDLTHTVSSWFGVQCIYTSTRSDKFWFDDFVVTGTRIPDTTPPAVVTWTSANPTQVRLEFSEPVNAVGINDHIVLEGIGFPAVATVSTDSLAVDLQFSQPMINGKGYGLTINGVADRQGNKLFSTIQVMYFKPGKPQPKSVVITELLPDPSPQVGLPAAEYVEIHNRSEDPFDLGNWIVTDGSSRGVLSTAILLPGEYLVLTASASVASFGDARVMGLTNFPSLNNSGDRIQLFDDSNVVIDSVEYSLPWYRDEDKQEGGWSLELIDPANPCGEEGNWSASEDPSGGTPGQVNSVWANKPDLTPPMITNVSITNPGQLIVTFNELLQPPGDWVKANLYPNRLIDDLAIQGSSPRELKITMAEPIQPRIRYTLHLSGVRDCAGNSLEKKELVVGLPEPADSGDLVISEILFNPRPGGSDFVELYNQSEKFIQLEEWHLRNETTTTTLPRFLLHPGHWVALSEDPYGVLLNYPLTKPDRVVKADLPSLPDDKGEVELLDSTGRSMDRVIYESSWHSVFLNDESGVSLERIDCSKRAGLPGNWISASAREGYATPGRANSQHRDSVEIDGRIQISPNVLPSGEFAQIHYRFDHGGMANVSVFSHGGTLVKRIAENEWLGNEGFLRWDGDRMDGQRAAAGYYFVWFEWLDTDGRTETYRERIIIVSR